MTGVTVGSQFDRFSFRSLAKYGWRNWIRASERIRRCGGPALRLYYEKDAVGRQSLTRYRSFRVRLGVPRRTDSVRAGRPPRTRLRPRHWSVALLAPSGPRYPAPPRRPTPPRFRTTYRFFYGAPSTLSRRDVTPPISSHSFAPHSEGVRRIPRTILARYFLNPKRLSRPTVIAQSYF